MFASGPQGSSCVELPRGLAHHQFGRVQARARLRQRKRHALVLTDRSPEDDPFARIGDRATQRGAADADRFRRHQNAFRVEPIQQVAESLALLAHPIGDCHRQVVIHDLARRHRVATEFVDRRDLHLRVAAVRPTTTSCRRCAARSCSSGVVRTSNSTRSESSAFVVHTLRPLYDVVIALVCARTS